MHFSHQLRYSKTFLVVEWAFAFYACGWQIDFIKVVLIL